MGSPSEAYDDTIAAGDVVSQDPAAGTSVAVGSTVSYVVSQGPEQVTVPDLSGAAADAEQALADARLVGSPSEAYDDTIAAGDVVSQDPAAGTSVAVGSTVSYVVSQGPEQVTVPDLSGAAADAEQALADARLVGSPSEAYDDTIAAGDVVSQDPAAGTSVAVGSTVSYVVSQGPEQVTVPDLSGAAADAEQALADARLVGSPSEAYDDTIAAGDVVSQDPAAGTSVAVGSTVSYVVSQGPEQVTVPDLSGAAADAEQALADARLVGSPSEAYDDTIAAGDVVSQDPAAGTSVAVGSTVSYVVSQGPEQVTVPDLSGAAADAEQALADARLVGSPSEAYDDTIAAGDVVSQDPAAGTSVAVGSTVSYVVSQGPEQVTVPDLSGAAADAEQALADARLVGSPSEAYDDTIAAGDVVSQDPAAGTSVAVGSTVSYVVSQGPEQVTVPDLSGAAADAEQALADARLVGSPSEAYDDTIAAGDVVSQDPAAGTSVAVGSTVSYVVSQGPEQVTVPDLSGAAADAEQALADARLVGSPSEAYDDTIAAGDVVSQDPAAGTSVAVGSTVSYVVSQGPEQVTVPDLSGAAADAEQALADARLVGSPSEAYDDTIAAGDVVSQDPAAGTSVAVGSTVSYVVSQGRTPEVAVPDVRGLPQADAIATIEAANLTVGETVAQTNEKVDAGDAIKTEPAAGSRIPIDSAVTLAVSTGSSMTTIPEVKDLPQADAVTAIEDSGLTVGSTEERTNANIPAGNAVKTDPAAGESVQLGTEVTLTVSKGPKPAVVPDVVGLPKAEAKAAITDAGLALGEETVVEDPAPKNAVLSQEPTAGAEIATGSAVDLTISSGPPTVEIPDVKGTSASDAQATLEGLGLSVLVDERTNGNIAAGDAVKTDPAAGTSVQVGSDVTLIVSKGPKQIEVPDVVGLDTAAAKAEIKGVKLSPGEITEMENDVASGTVLSQDPVAGSQVDQGSMVNLTVSSGPPLTTIPEVKDQSAADAQAALEAEGLVVDVQEKTNVNIPAGNAVKTDPAAGTEVQAGSNVSLIVSKGPKQVTVPNIVGLSEADATTAIEAAELQAGAVSAVDDAAPKNTVLSQDPAADAQVDKGSAVDYTVSSGPPSVEVPQVKDLPQADAVTAIEDSGLTVGSTEERTNANIPAGNAVKTDPAAGESVQLGTEVTLTVSKGPKPAVVPDVVGLPKAEAKAAITDAGLALGEETVVEDPAPKNAVLSQEPTAGAEIATGSAVDLTISSGPPTVKIPDVKGTSASDAQATLEGLGLSVLVDERTNGNIAAGDAVKTDPAAGTSVQVGSDVTLIVSKGPKQIEVPDVVGLDTAAAKAEIKGVKLSPGEITEMENDVASGTVLSQDPVAGSQVDQGSMVNLTVSSGPPLTTIPEVKDQSAADAQAALEAEGLVVDVQEKTNVNIPAGNAVKTDPAAGTEVQAGSNVSLIVSKGPKQVTVPNIVGLSEADATTAIEAAELQAGAVSAVDDAAPKNTVLSQDPAADAQVDKGSAVDYTVSLGPVIEPRGEGGSLDNPQVAAQLDAVAFAVPPIRELELGNTPYDGVSAGEQADLLSQRSESLYPAATLSQQEQALKRMGLLGSGDDLASLLDQLYGQDLPIAYLPDRGRQSIVDSIDKFDVTQRTEAAREFGQAAVHQQFGADAARTDDPTNGDAALAALSLEAGDGTATMLQWAAENVSSGNQAKSDRAIVPGDDGILASMPQLLQRDYSFPYLEGRLFVDRLRKDGGWGAVDSAWGRLPETTEQILHPQLYPDERPTTIVLDGLGGTLGKGWSEQWQQTMGELRTGVWLADGQPGTQEGPKAPVKLPKANAAAGWGGDRLVSLDGPDGSWAIVWQTKWDTAGDISQFVDAANAAVADLPGAHAVLEADVSSGASNPVLVLLTSDEASLAHVAEALGLGDVIPAPEPQ